MNKDIYYLMTQKMSQIMNKFIYILLLVSLNSFGQIPDGGRISHDQWYIIPEDPDSNDYVGRWYVNWTDTAFRDRSGWYEYEIVDGNTGDAFDMIDSMIVVLDSTALSHGSDFTLTIRTTIDNTYEDNHAFISVLHEDSCIYFDPDWGGAETGSRRTPYNNIEDDVTYEKNYAYLSKRGTAWSGDVTIASTMDSDIDNPLIFGAYDEGDRPIWYDGTNELVWIDSRTDTIEHVQFYDIDCWGNDGASTIKPDDYSWHTKFNRVRATRGDGNGCFMSNHALATTYNHNVFRDCEADSGYGYGFKMSSGRDTLENCMISNCNTGISFNWSNGGYAEYIWTSSNGDGSASAFTFDCDSNTVKHAIIYGYNVGLKFIDDDTPDSDVEGNLVEDCWHNQEMDLGSTNSHLYFSTNADRNTVQRCFFRNSEYAIDINSSCDTNWLNYIVVINADDFSIDNDGTGNICDHIVTYDHQASDIIGSGTGVLRNSIYTSASGLTSSDSILWGSIMDSDYVYDTIAGQEDFRLKAGATLAIDAGTDLGITRDLHDYIIPQGSAPDIGAYERIVDNVIQIGGINRWIIINDRKFIIK